MKNKLKEYKAKLEKSLCEYMELPANERTSSAVRGMIECWEVLSDMETCVCAESGFSRDDATKWNAKMLNEDGTAGGHWSLTQTNAVAQTLGIKFEHITDYCWNTAMNMMYSDYCGVATKYNLSIPDFCADMAKAFLFDKDAKSPNSKMAAYYCGIVNT